MESWEDILLTCYGPQCWTFWDQDHDYAQTRIPAGKILQGLAKQEKHLVT